MQNPDTEFIFPIRFLSELKSVRGSGWKSLVEDSVVKKHDLLNNVAMTLLMAKICGCNSCDTDSYRASRGCKICSQQALIKEKNNDAELVKMYKKLHKKVQQHLK